MRRAIAASCALVALGAACSGSSGNTAGTTTTTVPPTVARASTTTTTTRPTTPTTPPPDSLAALIVGDLPGYTRQPDDVGDTGPTSLAKAALDDVFCSLSCDARAELTADGFERGYQRQWTNVDPSGTQVQDFLYLYRFHTPEGAQRYAAHWRDTLLSNQGGAAVQEYIPAFIPGATGLTVSDQSGSTGVAIFTKGQYAVKAQVTGGPNADQSGSAGQLALAQYSRLP